MKKLITVLVVALLGSLFLVGCSCSSETSSIEIVSSGSSVNIKVVNASDTDTGEANIELDNDSKMVFDASSLTEGKLQAAFASNSGAAGPTVDVSAKEKVTFNLAAGSYTVTIKGVEKANGSATIAVE